MYVIDLDFKSLHDISVAECLSSTGVYVLWSPNAWERPSYLGDGNVLSRISSHCNNSEKPFASGGDGYIALLDDGSNPRKLKTDAEVAENTLLEAARTLGVYPKFNKASGKLASVFRRGQQHDTIRVNVRGWHPLRWDVRIRGTARLTWRWDEDWVLDEMPWRHS